MTSDAEQDLAQLAARGVAISEDRDSVEQAVERLRAARVLTATSLVTVLSDPGFNHELLADAVWLAGVLRISAAAEAVVRMLESCDDPDLIWKASDCLALIRDPRQVDALVAVFEEASEVMRRCAAALALAGLYDRRAVEALRRVLVDRSNESELRGYALEALGRLQAREVAAEIRPALGDASPVVRYWAAYAVGMLRDAAALPALKRLEASDTAVLENGKKVAEEALWAIDKITQGEFENDLPPQD